VQSFQNNKKYCYNCLLVSSNTELVDIILFWKWVSPAARRPGRWKNIIYDWGPIDEASWTSSSREEGSFENPYLCDCNSVINVDVLYCTVHSSHCRVTILLLAGWLERVMALHHDRKLSVCVCVCNYNNQPTQYNGKIFVIQLLYNYGDGLDSLTPTLAIVAHLTFTTTTTSSTSSRRPLD